MDLGGAVVKRELLEETGSSACSDFSLAERLLDEEESSSC